MVSVDVKQHPPQPHLVVVVEVLSQLVSIANRRATNVLLEIQKLFYKDSFLCAKGFSAGRLLIAALTILYLLNINRK